MVATTALRRRLPVMLFGVLSLLAGLWGGLLLLGLNVPTLRAATATDHGPLRALGFLGTVIALERAVALGRAWSYAAPAASGLGGLALLLGLPAALGWALLCLAAVVFVLIYAAVLHIDRSFHLIVMTAGAVCWYITTIVWFGGWTIPRLVPWLAGFLVFTILGERLELARVALLTRASVRRFSAAGATFALGLLLTVVSGRTTELGIRVAGAGLIGLALWGLRYDAARRTIRIKGVTRFMAACLLAGYVWLLAAGAIWLAAGDIGASRALYDSALHAVFLGFVMSMIFAHAPVIVPAVLRTPLPFRPWFYAHAGLLHAALLVRLVGGDAFDNVLAWQIGGAATEVAVLLFLGASAYAVIRGRRKPGRRAPVTRQPVSAG
jgi:hypothetical protein